MKTEQARVTEQGVVIVRSDSRSHDPWYSPATESLEHTVSATLLEPTTLEPVRSESIRWVGDGDQDEAVDLVTERVQHD